MTFPITPNPAIHVQPKDIRQQQMLFSGGQLEAWKQSLPLAMTLQLMDAILKALGVSQTDIDAYNNDATTYYNSVQTKLGTVNTDLAALQADSSASTAAFGTLLTSWEAAIAGYTNWSTFITALETAWNTYSMTESGLTSSAIFTLQNLFNTLLGINTSTGQMSAGNVSNSLGGSSLGADVQAILDYIANALGHSGTGHSLTQIETYLGLIPPANVTNVLGGANLGADVSAVHTTVGTNTTSIASQQAWWNSLATDLWIYADLFHAYYPAGSPSDTATTTSGGRRTWYSAIADMKVLFAAIGSSPPVVAATDIGGAVTTAQSTATSASSAASTAQSTATTANTAASTANTMFGLSQQAGTNLVLSPGFESTAAWTSASAGTQSTLQAHSGTNSWLLQGTGSGNTTTLRLINNSAGPVTLKSRPGEVFQLQAFVYPKTGNTGGGTAALQIVCTDSTSVNSPTTLVAATETVPATGSWSSLSGTATVPAGYDTVDPQLILLSVPTTDFVYVDDLLVRETTLATSAQSSATAAQANAESALSQLTAIPAQTIVPNLTGSASSVTSGNAGSGGSATNPSGSVSTPLSCTGTQTIGSTASVMIAAVTFSLVGSGSQGNAQVSIGSQQMQPVGSILQLSPATEFVEFFILWNPPVGIGQTVTATAYGMLGAGVGSVSFESASYVGATTVSTLVTNSGTGTSLSLSVPAAIAGTMAVAAFSAGDVLTKANTALSAFTKTSRGNTTVQVNSTQYGYQSLVFGDTAGGAGGVTFGATGADASAGWVGAGLVLSATSIIGSGFHVANTSTTPVTALSGTNVLAGGFFNGTPTSTSDYTYNNTTNALTVKNAGWYSATISLLTSTSYTSFMLGPVLYQNGAVAQSGMRQFMSSGQSWVLQSTFSIYCNANDTLQPGSFSGTTFGSTFVGESTGTSSYWEVSLLNRSLL